MRRFACNFNKGYSNNTDAKKTTRMNAPLFSARNTDKLFQILSNLDNCDDIQRITELLPLTTERR